MLYGETHIEVFGPSWWRVLCFHKTRTVIYMVQILKSSRHSKITGDFTEHLVLYWLSKHGFECARIDHTGIDLIARSPHSDELLGISVKSRSRNPGTETASINIKESDIVKAVEACATFRCIPYFAIVSDMKDKIVCFVLPITRLREILNDTKEVHQWKMTDAALAAYSADPQIKSFEFQTHTGAWWGE